MLVVQKFKRDRQRNHSEVSSDNAMVSEALNYLGIRYRFGGNSPDTGFDCSGLVTYTAERSLGLKPVSYTHLGGVSGGSGERKNDDAHAGKPAWASRIMLPSGREPSTPSA